MRHFGLACLALLPLIQGCGPSSVVQSESKLVTAKIINGSKIDVINPITKSTVLLYTDNGYCTGTLIAPNVVLTAAHCFNQDKPKDVQVMPGALIEAQSAKQIKLSVRNIFIHPDWSTSNASKVSDDVALVELEKSVDSTYKPIALFDGPLPSDNGMFPLEVYGYSAFTTNSSIDLTDYFKDIKRESLPTFDSRFGTLRLNGKLLGASENPYKSYGENFIFVNQLSGGMCSGDSGGPMVVDIDGEKVQIGINKAMISTKGGEIDCSSYSVSTYVQAYIPWINKTLAAHKLAKVVTKHFANPEDITKDSNDTSCIYTQGNVTSFLEAAKENIVNNVCDKKLITDLEEYVDYAKTYCTTDISRSYQDALKATLKTVSANCQAEIKN